MKKWEWTEAQLAAPASDFWQIDKTTTGPVYRTCFLVTVRHLSGSPSRLLLTTTDLQRVAAVEGAALRALDTLTNREFLRLFHLEDPAQAAAPVVGLDTRR